ncbi:MAG: MBL fold metallo-hydrolase [Lysinibacillus sp.]|nr:MBL fold metallo-hydrolase [Lysinibacillus sp.]
MSSIFNNRNNKNEWTLPPVLETTPKCKLTVMNAGFSKINNKHLLKGANSSDVLVPALFFLIEHPIHGYILFDTGYSTRFYEATKSFPFSIMNRLTPVQISEKDNAVAQLLQMNISTSQIQTVILSHLHADHVGGISDFKFSTIYVDKREWEFCQQSKIKLLFKGYLKELIENIHLSSLKQLDFDKNGSSYGPFKNTIDLFNDATVILVPLPGHAIGQFGLLLNISNQERYFLIADSVYVKENYQKNRGGSFLSRFAHYNLKQYKSNFPMLKQLEIANPNLMMIPTHDSQMYTLFIQKAKKHHSLIKRK